MTERATEQQQQRLLAKVDILESLLPEEVERLALRSASVRLKAGEAIALDGNRQTVRSHPVEQPEVDRLGQIAVVFGDRFSGGKTFSRERVKVSAFGTGREHLCITGDLGHNP